MMKVAIAADHAGSPATLQTDGADAFVKSWDDLLACIGSKSDQVRTANEP
jgi:hypothetical protein